METRDQWYKPNLLYNIHWRPPRKPELPKMIVETVQFNPSACTCGEHGCEPRYKMEKRVLWTNKEILKSIKRDPVDGFGEDCEHGKHHLHHNSLESLKKDGERERVGDSDSGRNKNDINFQGESMKNNEDSFNTSDSNKTNDDTEYNIEHDEGSRHSERFGTEVNRQRNEESDISDIETCRVKTVVEIDGGNDSYVNRICEREAVSSYDKCKDGDAFDNKTRVDLLGYGFDSCVDGNSEAGDKINQDNKMASQYEDIVVGIDDVKKNNREDVVCKYGKCEDEAREDYEYDSGVIKKSDGINDSISGNDNLMHDIQVNQCEEISLAFGILTVYCNSELHCMVQSTRGVS